MGEQHLEHFCCFFSFGICLFSSSVCFPSDLQHFGAGSCHFNHICNMELPVSGVHPKKPGCNGNACRDATGVKLRTQFPNLSEPDAAFPGVEISTDLGSTFFCSPTRYH